jgi:hypothetical protein
MDRDASVDSSRDADYKTTLCGCFSEGLRYISTLGSLSSQESSNNYNNRTYRPLSQMRPRAAASIEVFAMKTAWEKFQSATVCLARSGGIKDRLTDAYRNYLALVAEDDLPKELREDFRAFGRALTRERPLLRGEDAFRATIRKMSNDEADQIATSVVLMFAAIPRSFTPVMRSLNSAQILPLYLAEAAEAQVRASVALAR